MTFEVALGTARPGYYAGISKLKCWTAATNRALPDRDIEVEVHIAGREISPARLQSQDEGNEVHAGHRFVVLFNLECTDCDLGGGQLVFTPLAESREGEPNRGSSQPQVIRVAAEHLTKEGGGPGHGTECYSVRVPAVLDQVGQFQLKTEWRPLADPAGPSRWVPWERTLDELLVTSLPSITVDQRFPCVYEWTRVRIIASSFRGAPDLVQVNVVRYDDDGSEKTEGLLLVDDGDTARADEISGDGIYSAYYQFPRPGKYLFDAGADNALGVVIAPAAAQTFGSLGGRLAPSEQGDLTPASLEVPIPNDADRTRGWETVLANILTIAPSLPSEVKWSARVSRVSGDEVQDARREPLFSLLASATDADPTEGALAQRGTLSPGQAVTLALKVALPAVPDGEGQSHPAWTPQAHDLTLALELSWNSPDGTPIQRTELIPFQVEVCQPGSVGKWVWIVLGAVVVAATLLLVRFLTRRLKLERLESVR